MAPPLFHRSSYCFRNSFCKLLFFIFFFCFLGYYLELRYDMYFSVLYRQFNRQRRLRICNAANYWPLEGPSRTCFVNPTQKIAPKEGPKKCKKAPIVAKLKKNGDELSQNQSCNTCLFQSQIFRICRCSSHVYFIFFSNLFYRLIQINCLH